MEEARSGYRVLIADDDVHVHQSLTTYFRREGYQTLSAYDGEDAIRQVRQSRPDMCLLDIMMPKMDGLVVCREVRKFSTLPIIMLTAKGEEFDKLLGLELGADDYITKPFSPTGGAGPRQGGAEAHVRAEGRGKEQASGGFKP